MGVVVLMAAAVLALCALVVVVARRTRDRSPSAAYERDVRGIRLATYRQTAPRYTRQVGEPIGYYGNTGPPVSF